MKTSLALVALAAAPVLAGCVKRESVESQDVTTHGMSLDYMVTNDGDKTAVYAALHVGSWESATFAKLTTGDQLIINDPTGKQQALAIQQAGGKTWYAADLTPAQSGEFKLDFIRAKGASALGNKVIVPPAFTVTAPTTQSRMSALTFSWGAASNGKMSYTLSGDCIQAHAPKDIIGDPGSFTLNAGEIKAQTGKEMASCQVKLTVTRQLETSPCCSSEFGHPSKGIGRAIRTIAFQSTP